MLRTDVADALRREFGEDGYLFPDYEGYCFANVPHTVASVLGVETGRTRTHRTLPEDVLSNVDAQGVETVLVVLVDGFGFEQWRRERDHHGFLDRLTDAARVTPLTSLYPSETAAAMNTFHTGRLPAEHGVVGWNVYEPSVDASFEALPFVTKDGEEPPIDFGDVADADPIYSALADAGVSSHHVVPFETTTGGATKYTYESLADLPGRVRDALDATRREDARSYCYAYLPHVDAAAHRTGTDSANYRETVGEAFAAIEAGLAGLDDTAADETLVVVTADHGHVNTDPERNVNLDAKDWLVDALARHPTGRPCDSRGVRGPSTSTCGRTATARRTRRRSPRACARNWTHSRSRRRRRWTGACSATWSPRRRSGGDSGTWS